MLDGEVNGYLGPGTVRGNGCVAEISCEMRHSHEGAGSDPEGLKRSSRSDAITPSGLPAGSPRGSAF